MLRVMLAEQAAVERRQAVRIGGRGRMHSRRTSRKQARSVGAARESMARTGDCGHIGEGVTA